MEHGRVSGNGRYRFGVVPRAMAAFLFAQPIMRWMTPETVATAALPAVPLTVEGASVLHQMMRFRWPAWRALSHDARAELAAEASAAISGMRNTAVYSMLGHKGDLMLVHFRKDFEELSRIQLELAR